MGGFPTYQPLPEDGGGGPSAPDAATPAGSARSPGSPRSSAKTPATGAGQGPPEELVPTHEALAERIPHADLRQAVLALLQGWQEGQEEARAGTGRQLELTDELIALAESVVTASHGGPVVRPGDGVVLRRRLLELLRRELVGVWARDASLRPEADEMTGALQAMEQVAEALSPHWDAQFGVDLQGPDGLELAVEVAHDFRSPLSSILFLADTLREGGSGELNALQRRQLSLIYGAALSMVSMATDVVDMGRGGHRAGQREPNPFSISEVMASVRGIVEPMAEAKGLSLAVRTPENDDVRQGDVEALRRVLLNLTTNAVKFTAEGFVELSADHQGPLEVQFSVRDTGPGIRDGAQRDLYRTFRPFQGRSGYHFSGTGLGLTIARKLVRSMEGELHYETQKNLGTRFYFTIPLPTADVV